MYGNPESRHGKNLLNNLTSAFNAAHERRGGYNHVAHANNPEAITVEDTKGGSDFFGDNMQIRTTSTGLRAALLNTRKTIMKDIDTTVETETEPSRVIKMVDRIIDYMRLMRIDIFVLLETGDIRKKTNLIESKAESIGFKACCFPSESKAAGVVILINSNWKKALETSATIHANKNGDIRAVACEFKDTQHRDKADKSKPQERFLLVAAHGYNDSTGSNKTEAESLKKQIATRIKKYKNKDKGKNRFGSILILADLNAAKHPLLDTDGVNRNATMVRETDANTAESFIAETNTHDVYRDKFPQVQTWSRIATSGTAARRIDYALTSKEISKHLATRVGYHKDSGLSSSPEDEEKKSDHMPLIIDVPIDCAGLAQGTIDKWPQSKVEIRSMQVVEKGIREEIDRIVADQEATPRDCSLEERSTRITNKIKQVMEEAGAVKSKTMTYPRRVKMYTGLATTGYNLKAWKSKLVNATKVLDRHGAPTDSMASMFRFQKVKKALEKLKRTNKLRDATFDGLTFIEELDQDQCKNTTMPKQEFVSLLREQSTQISRYINRTVDRARSKYMKGKIREREADAAACGGKAIRSIFNTHQTRTSLDWARRKDGSVADTPESLGECIAEKYEKWFKSVVSVTERFGPDLTEREAWEKMMKLECDLAPEEKYKVSHQTCQQPTELSFKDLIQEAYIDPGLFKKAKDEGWWEGIFEEIDNAELEESIQETQSGKATGPSKLKAEEIKLLGKVHQDELRDLFNDFLKERRIPDNINVALLRLLPKTEAGLGNLDKTRPIALMETLTKLYERIIIKRITKKINQHKILDLSQYGATSDGGTMQPRRILQAILEDSALSKKQLHIIGLDLSKAFDTAEYWSQALSWRALGLPEDMIKILINLDAGSNSPADPRPGPGATTQVILDAGRLSPQFTHGRGVRQGSVGGPIKWIVFMNFWLSWIKKTMKGKGYKIEGDPENPFNPSSQKEEVIAQMFIDDSIWASNTKEGAEEILRRSELFCKFHGISINKEKSENISINYEFGDSLRWIPDADHKRGRPFPRKGKSGKCNPNDTPASDGRVMKYLGIYNQAKQGWKVQRDFLSKKQASLLNEMAGKPMSVSTAVRMINMKIIPAMIDSLHIITAPKSQLDTWDKANIKQVRQAGSLPQSIPWEVYFLPPEIGGMGLISLADRTTRVRIEDLYNGLNDTQITAQGEKPTLFSKVVRIQQKWHDTPGSYAAACKVELEKVKLAIEPVLNKFKTHTLFEEDATHAAEHGTSTGPVLIYTDGGTQPEPKPKTGWGYVTYTERKGRYDPIEKQIGSASGRLHGLQSNDIGEAMAVLQALRKTKLEHDATLFIDNTGVVQTCSKDHSKSPRSRLRQGGRAVWNRICALIRTRKVHGAQTKFEWIHSHVDKDDRQKWKEEWVFDCACGGGNNPDRQCNPHHKHHIRNEEADTLATQGINKDIPIDDQLNCQAGEEQYVLRRDRGSKHILQGDIRNEIQQRVSDARLQSMNARAVKDDLEKAGAWLVRAYDAHQPTMLRLSKTTRVSQRFRIRAWTDTLCTNHEEFIKSGSGSKQEVYEKDGVNLLDGGRCRCCDLNATETVQHMLECPSGGDIRQHAEANIDRIWREKGKGDIWKQLKQRWIKGEGQQEQKWLTWWAYLGIIQKSLVAETTRDALPEELAGLTELIGDTAIRLLQCLEEQWKLRNEKNRAWEKEAGITERKTKAARRGWRTLIAPLGRRKKPISELKEGTYKHSREKREERIALHKAFGPLEGECRWNVWLEGRKAMLRTRRAATAMEGETIHKYTAKTTARFPNRKSKAKRFRTARPMKAQEGKCPVILETGTQCDAPTAGTAVGCKRNEQRCRVHLLNPICNGLMSFCRCRAEDTDSRGKKPEEERRIRMGTSIRLKTQDGTWAEGVVVQIKYLKNKGRKRKKAGLESRRMSIKLVNEDSATVHVDSDDLLRTGQWWIVAQPPAQENEAPLSSEDDETSGTSESSADTQEEPEKITVATSADNASPTPELMPPSATIACQGTHEMTHHGLTSPLTDSSPLPLTHPACPVAAPAPLNPPRRVTRKSATERQQWRRQEEKTQEARRKMEISEETMALMSMATVAVSPGKDDEMEGISKKENKRRQSRREREAEAKQEDRERQGKKKQSSLKAYLTREENPD